MNRGRSYKGFWAVALCHSPHGWLVNAGPWWLTFGDFELDCDTTRRLQKTCEHPRLYWCPTPPGQFECPDCGGFDVCCSAPERHVDASCCRGTGFADYAAVPCPNPCCPAVKAIRQGLDR